MKTPRATNSASNIFRRALCLGSGSQEAGIADTDNEFSEEGRMLHELFMTGNRPATLTLEQIGTLNSADYYANEFLGILSAQCGVPSDAEFIDEREVPMMLYDAAGKEVFPGRVDFVRNWPRYKVRGIIDAKFGFMDVDHAPDNLQLASYAVMRQQQSPADFTGVCITQPRNFGPRFTHAVYTAGQLVAAGAELARIHYASKVEGAPLTAGQKQCHFCRAKAVCPAYAEKYQAVEVVRTKALDKLDTEQFIHVLEAVQFAAKIADEVRGEARVRFNAGELPGFKLQNSGDVTEVVNTLGLFQALKTYFAQQEPQETDGEAGQVTKFTATAFEACRKVEMGKLVELLCALMPIAKKKVEEFLKVISAPYCTRTPKAKRIVREKTPPAFAGENAAARLAEEEASE